jgi:hypothetical protein
MLSLLIFFVNLRLPIHPGHVDDARERPKFDDITDSFAVGIWALVGLQGTALEFVFDIPTIKHCPR